MNKRYKICVECLERKHYNLVHHRQGMNAVTRVYDMADCNSSLNTAKIRLMGNEKGFLNPVNTKCEDDICSDCKYEMEHLILSRGSVA